jgi:hypothetical protein
MKILDLLSNLNIENYLKENDIEAILKKKFTSGRELKGLFDSVDPYNKVPFPAEFGDLVRLHFLIRERKVINILEFGVGKSTAVFSDALIKNYHEHYEYVIKNLRKIDPFRCVSVDNSEHWINLVKQTYNLDRVTLQYSEVIMGQFNGRICTYYERKYAQCLSRPNLLRWTWPTKR